ncbi:S8 family serine peptidase [Aquihabitans sp. G128]|uniref:S8 family serine peptidase n=1 Tax=Aquihabitans sp. G128 TaxID=2849779 RepID=UPI001C23FC08|nr:S8 family serine peptidase [Aquihabitans sp. G128]QXC60182.1 S8 family serine peptidase [Aquihabitans sp. G128]
MRAPLRTPRSRRAAIATLLVTGLALTSTWAPASAAPAQDAPAPSAEAKPTGVLSTRLDALAASAGQRRSSADASASVGLPASGPGSLLRHDGKLYVDVVATDASAIAAAAGLPGAELVATLPDGVNATVALPASSLAGLGGIAGLRSATELLAPKVHRSAAPAPAAGAARAAATCPTGVRSQGDTQLKAALARSTYAVDGTGITVGVISDSFRAAPREATADVASGDLPGAGNPCGHTTPVQVLADDTAGSDEGRAMAQIVHDLAPGAKLLFATADRGDIDFANQIRALRDAGADVIVDDIAYFNEPIYQDGPISVAIHEVGADGVAYYSAAGNAEYEVGGRSVGSYEAQAFRPTACPAAITNSTCHDFDPGAGVTAYDSLTLAGGTDLIINMGWNEPISGVGTDYDIVLVDPATGKAVAGGGDANLSSGQPVEYFGFTNPSSSAKTYRLYVARYADPDGPAATGTPRFKFILQSGSLTAVGFGTDAGGDVFGPTVYGHSATTAMQSVAAVPAGAGTAVEDFSSHGPATYCWAPATGSAPAAALPSCTTRTVDLAATDGVSTTLPGDSGLNPFYGTSAAAPHAAAVAALMLQRRPCRTPAELYAAQQATGRHLSGETQDSEGAGLVDAAGAVGSLASCATTPSHPGTPTVSSAGAAKVTIAWKAPATLGGGTLSGYTVEVTNQAGTVLSTTTGSTATSRTITGLPAGGAFRFRVRAEVGTSSAWSPRSAVAVPPFAPIDQFTLRQFVDFAGRFPTAQELQDGKRAITANLASPGARVAKASGFSTWGPALDPVSRMAYAAFKKAPEASTLAYWLPKRRAGTTVAAMAESFVTSDRFKKGWGPLTNRQFVQRIYLNVLGHDGPAASIDSYTTKLDEKQTTRGAILATLSEGAAHVARRKGEVATVDLFYGMLVRVPTAAELTQWSATTASDRVPLANRLLISPAYDART